MKEHSDNEMFFESRRLWALLRFDRFFITQMASAMAACQHT
jgi:hypothetical protein